MKVNWKDLMVKALIRALRTFCQTFAGSITVGALWSEVQWIPALSVAGVASVYSILMSISTGLPEVEKIEDKPPADE